MKKLLELLIIIFILGMISGIIPGLMVALMYKFPILIVPILLFDFGWIMFEFCYEGK